MKHESWRDLIERKIESEDSDFIDKLSQYLAELDEAKQTLRDKGYGWTGLSLLETVKRI